MLDDCVALALTVRIMGGSAHLVVKTGVELGTRVDKVIMSTFLCRGISPAVPFLWLAFRLEPLRLDLLPDPLRRLFLRTEFTMIGIVSPQCKGSSWAFVSSRPLVTRYPGFQPWGPAFIHVRNHDVCFTSRHEGSLVFIYTPRGTNPGIPYSNSSESTIIV